MTEARGWHVLLYEIHYRHPTCLATDQEPSLAGNSVSPVTPFDLTFRAWESTLKAEFSSFWLFIFYVTYVLF